jgi:hypothetical protein
MFDCPHCNAAPELVVDDRAQLSVVRHALDCLTLQAQVRARWPEPAGLPDTPTQFPFAQRAAFGRWHRTVQAKAVTRFRGTWNVTARDRQDPWVS